MLSSAIGTRLSAPLRPRAHAHARACERQQMRAPTRTRAAHPGKNLSAPGDLNAGLFPHAYAAGARTYSMSWDSASLGYTRFDRRLGRAGLGWAWFWLRPGLAWPGMWFS